jgi:hypothetical protein
MFDIELLNDEDEIKEQMMLIKFVSDSEFCGSWTFHQRLLVLSNFGGDRHSTGCW